MCIKNVLINRDLESGCARHASCDANDWKIRARVVLDQLSNLSCVCVSVCVVVSCVEQCVQVKRIDGGLGNV